MEIRPETPADYAAIAAVNARAFGRAAEPAIVALHRQRPEFDPELSLVAVNSGTIAGHVLFSPRVIRLAGRDVPAVNLAPIAVDPEYQRCGIGAGLIRAGHDAARAKGYAVSFLLGHPEYYSRFGYRPNMFGESWAVPDREPNLRLEERTPVESDVPALRRLWLDQESEVDFAIVPGSSLLDWVSPDPHVKSAVYVRNGQIVGYTRARGENAERPIDFLAANGKYAQAIACRFRECPVHPRSPFSEVFGSPECVPWEAGMGCALLSGALEGCVGRPPGRPIWPVEFDVA